MDIVNEFKFSFSVDFRRVVVLEKKKKKKKLKGHDFLFVCVCLFVCFFAPVYLCLFSSLPFLSEV